MSRILAVDLGTSNSCVAVMEDPSPRVILNRQGARATPSVVAFKDRGDALVGQFAKSQAGAQVESTVSGFLRLLGRRYDSVEVQEAKGKLPYEIVEGDNGGTLVRVAGGDYSLTELAAFVLSNLKADAEDALGEAVEEAVLAVPSHFNNAQRQAAKDAASIAGLRIQRIVNASTAAALAYGLKAGRAGPIAVYDLGGGTLDVSIVQLHEGLAQVLATGGDAYLGGEDIDRLIVEWLVEEARREHNVDLRERGEAYRRAKVAAERAKCELSRAEQAEISLALDGLGTSGARAFEVVLTRAQLEKLIAPVLERTITPCRRALKDAGLTPMELDRVILAGRQTQTPKVSQTAAQAFGAEPEAEVDPGDLVAMGAAVQAGVLEGRRRDVVLVDVTPHTLGIETMGGAFTPLIERNSVIPTRKSRVFTTVFDNQSRVELHVLQGESDKAALDTSLGKFQLRDIAPAPKGVPQIEVSFEIDMDGIFKVSARDQATGREQDVTARTTTGLSEEEVGRLRARLAEHLSKEQKRRARQLKAELQMLSASLRKALAGSSAVLNEQQSQAVTSALEAAEAALAGSAGGLESILARLVEAADMLRDAAK